MSSKAAHRYRMVIALDLSEYSRVVLEHGFDLAARHDACDIHLIVVHEEDARIEDEKQKLTALTRDNLETFGGAKRDWAVRLHVRKGNITDQIAALAGEALADVIVIGRFGRHGAQGRFGGVTESVLAQAPCSTLVVQLTDHAVEAHPQCPDCVTVRRESPGGTLVLRRAHRPRPRQHVRVPRRRWLHRRRIDVVTPIATPRSDQSSNRRGEHQRCLTPEGRRQSPQGDVERDGKRMSGPPGSSASFHARMPLSRTTLPSRSRRRGPGRVDVTSACDVARGRRRTEGCARY